MNCDNISSHQHHNGTSVRLFQAIKKLKSSIKGYGVKRKKKETGSESYCFNRMAKSLESNL